MTTIFDAWVYDRFIEIQSNLGRNNLYRTNEGSDIFGASFSNRDTVRPTVQLSPNQINPRILKHDFFPRIDSSIFTSITPVLLVRSKETSWVSPTLKSTSRVLSQSTLSRRSDSSSVANSSWCLITLTVESSTISIDSNITDNIIRMVIINVQNEKCRTKNWGFRNSRINWIFLWVLHIQNHSEPSITEKRQNKATYLT